MAKKGLDLNIKNILSNKTERAILMICIGIAFVFWIFSKLSKNYDSEILVNLEYELPNESSILTRKPPSSLEVTLDGRGWDLLFHSIGRRRQKLEYKLNQDTLQEIRLQRLTRDLQFKLGFGVDIGTINPDNIPLKMDVKTRKRIPVKLVNQITLAEQFVEVPPKTIIPDTVVIEGPYSILRNIKEWHTELLDVKELSFRLRDTISLAQYPNKQVNFKPDYVAYDVLVEQLTEKEIEVPIVLAEPNPNVIVFPKSIKVKCTIGLSNYEKLSPTQFVIKVDISKGENGMVTIDEEDVKKPEFIQLVDYETLTFNYFVVKQN